MSRSHSGVTAYIVTMAKSLTEGMGLSPIVGGDDVMDSSRGNSRYLGVMVAFELVTDKIAHAPDNNLAAELPQSEPACSRRAPYEASVSN